MSDNELININQMTDEQIMKAIGQDDGTSSSDGIPRLSINRSPEDDDGNQIPVGNFSVSLHCKGRGRCRTPLKDLATRLNGAPMTVT